MMFTSRCCQEDNRKGTTRQMVDLGQMGSEQIMQSEQGGNSGDFLWDELPAATPFLPVIAHSRRAGPSSPSSSWFRVKGRLQCGGWDAAYISVFFQGTKSVLLGEALSERFPADGHLLANTFSHSTLTLRGAEFL